MRELFVYNDPDDLAARLSVIIINLITQTLKFQEEFFLAVSGGTTPKKIFAHLAQKHADFQHWDNIQLFWVDERCVPPDHEDSNYRMTHDTLLKRIEYQVSKVHRIRGEEDPEKEAKRYGELVNSLVPIADSRPVFDLILLGMGEDGHTASIFPDQMELFESAENCQVAVHPKSKQRRITLTGPVLNNSRHVYFIITGKNKSETFKHVFDKNISDKYPASLINPVRGKLEWHIDQAAAGK